jgi:hypothetical protein
VGVPSDYPLHAGQRTFTVRDLVQSEAAICRDGQELTFTLIGMVHYLDTDTRWQSHDGHRWDFERLIREELKQPVIGAACGGTHRLMGLSYAVQRRHEEGKEIRGQWSRAEIFIDDFIEYAWQLQNPDGSMSTQWFEGRADSGDVDRKVRTTGHILEWLVYATPEDQLQEERMVRCVRFLVQAMLQNRDRAWDVGPKGHALRALAQYHRRVFPDSPSPWQGSATAGRAPSQTPSARR